jgi:hypothetical protein
LTDSDLTRHLVELNGLLRHHQALWRPQPFYEIHPAWRVSHPRLAEAALALDDNTVEALLADNHALHAWIAGLEPTLRNLGSMTALPGPKFHSDQSAVTHGRASWFIPGRKQAQIDAFSAALTPTTAPVLEWCAGKGHLGRQLARQRGQGVLSLEIDEQLCAEGSVLATRQGVAQTFRQADVLKAENLEHLVNRHVVALHACGDLHRVLVRSAPGRAVAIDLAPCCYYRAANTRHQAFNPEADLALSRDELHLAVTDGNLLSPRDRRLRDQAMARKLGFLAWYREQTGSARPAKFPSVPNAWNQLPFTEYCARLARRAGVAPPEGSAIIAFEAIGERRRAEVQRLNLIRLAFRRPMEIWLALDMALYLQRAGYQATLTEFCSADLTPRNLLISARA